MRIGKYWATPAAHDDSCGNYFGSAFLVWNEGEEMITRAIEFEQPFNSSEDALQHALEQVKAHVRDGAL